jgi:hypothetical protein
MTKTFTTVGSHSLVILGSPVMMLLGKIAGGSFVWNFEFA